MKDSCIKASLSDGDIEKLVEAERERLHRIILKQLCLIGEKVVAHARTLPAFNAKGYERGKIPPHVPNYADWTANLRSSIGYIVSLGDQIAGSSDFAAIDGARDGSTKGRELAVLLSARLDSDYSLIVVAGEEYASYVQAKGYDVLASAEILAEKLIKDLRTKLGQS